MKRTTIMLAVGTTLIISARGQGFINLDFESASAQNLTNNAFVATTSAVPGWATYSGSSSLTEIYYETNHPDGSTAVVLDGGSLALSGNFSVWLDQGGSISQTGSVPADAESLQFWAYGPGPSGSLPPVTQLRVSLGGQSLLYSALSQGPNYWVYGANIPAGLAGQMEALSFFIGGGGLGNLRLDNIGFSPLSVPEPSSFALLGLSALLLRLLRHKSQR
jgi:hypothetical protein